MDKLQALKSWMEKTFLKGCNKVSVLKGRRSFEAGWESREALLSPTDAVAMKETIETIIEEGYDKNTRATGGGYEADTTYCHGLVEYCVPLLLTLLSHSGVASQASNEIVEALEQLLDAIPGQTYDADWWYDDLRYAIDRAKAALEKLPAPAPPAAGPVWVKGAPPFGIWFAWYQWDDENMMHCVITASEDAEGLVYEIGGTVRIAPSRIVKYLDNMDGVPTSDLIPAQQLFTREQMAKAYTHGTRNATAFPGEYLDTEEYMNTNYPTSKQIKQSPLKQSIMPEIPQTCKGVKCMQPFCRNQAMHKVGEYNPFIPTEEKEQHETFNRAHEKTTYLCDDHFNKLMKREEFYGDVSTYRSPLDSLEGCPFHYCDNNPKCEDKCRYATPQPPVTG